MQRGHPPNTDATEFAGQLFFRLWRASHTRIAERLESVGLTPASFSVLNLLGKRDAASQQEIGKAMGIDPSTMVALLDGLDHVAEYWCRRLEGRDADQARHDSEHQDEGSDHERIGPGHVAPC